MSDADARLIEELRQGDPGAWERLIDRYAGLALSVPLKMGLSRADAEEVCQATWVVLYRHLLLIKKPGALSAWILTTATRESMKLQRIGARFGSLDPALSLELEFEGPSPRESLDRLERIQEVRDHVEGMSRPYRRLMDKLFFDPRKLSYAQIAEELDIPVGSIGPMRGRCLAGLARKLTMQMRRKERRQESSGIVRETAV